jgi:hypothetical protein
MFLVPALAFGKSARAMRICFSFAKPPSCERETFGRQSLLHFKKGLVTLPLQRHRLHVEVPCGCG